MLLFENYLSLILITILIFTLIIYYIKYLWDRRWIYYWSFKMPGPSPAWPIIGNALYFMGSTQLDIYSSLEKLFKEFKTPFRFWMGNKLIVGISQPKHLEIILNQALEKHEFYQVTTPLIGQGLLKAPVSVWKQHRRIINPSFNQRFLNSFIEIYSEQAEILVEQAGKYLGQGSFDIEKMLNCCSLDMLTETILDYQIQFQTGDIQIEHDIHRITDIEFQRMFKLWLHPDFIFNLTPMKREEQQCIGRLKELILKIMETKKLEYRQRKELEKYDDFNEGPKQRKVFLDSLIELSEEEGTWTEKEIFDETTLMLLAGTGSSTSTNGFVLLMLGMHPEIQDKVYKELYEIFGTSNRSVTKQDLNQMIYLERVIKETLRLMPTIPVIARSIDKDIKLDDYVLPKGSGYLFNIAHLHMNEEIWPEPNKFNPDRFLPTEVAKRHPYSFLPFSGGPRDCIGKQFAMMSMKTVMATFLRRYKVKTPYKTIDDIRVKLHFVLKAVDGFLVELESRF